MGKKLTVGEVVAKVMHDRDWSRAKVGRHVGVPASTIQGWTLGSKPRKYDIDKLLELADVEPDSVDFTSVAKKSQHDKIDELRKVSS